MINLSNNADQMVTTVRTCFYFSIFVIVAADPVSEGALKHSLTPLQSGQKRSPAVSQSWGTERLVLRKHRFLLFCLFSPLTWNASLICAEIPQGGSADPQLHGGKLPSAGGAAQLPRPQQGSNDRNKQQQIIWNNILSVGLICWADVLVLGLHRLPERPVLRRDGGAALPFPLLLPVGVGLHRHPLRSARSLEELPQVSPSFVFARPPMHLK